jgi:bacillolysin
MASAALAVVSLLGSLPGSAVAAPASSSPTVRRFPELSEARLSSHSETGKVRFIGSRPRHMIARPSALAASAGPVAAARAYAERYAPLFGLRSAAAELRVDHTFAGRRSVVRLRQVHHGIPVIGGELVVRLDASNNLISAGGEISPRAKVEVEPLIPRARAIRDAKLVVARSGRADPAALQASRPELWIYDARLLGGPGIRGPRLVWRTEVVGGATEPIRELVLVDARRGGIALSIDQIAHAKLRRVCNNDNDRRRTWECLSDFARVEGQAPTGLADVDNAYDFSGDTYDFFFDRFGRDSLDGKGMRLRSTVKFCDFSAPCPFPNAFWNGIQMVYGDGFASADDVVGHELAHGFTDHTSALFYYYQSGAINESLSDVFGELIDLTNDAGNDTAGMRWKLGEDLPPSIGVMRDMADPPAFSNPDRMTSPLYWSDPEDAGGVHSNSGVNNKAASLMVDGGSFNSKTVTALGIDKTARIYYDVATNYLTSGSDYADLYDYLQAACFDNVGGEEEITESDCAEVKDAVDATEMNLQPITGADAISAPFCDTPDDESNDLFFDDIERPESGKWTKTGKRFVWYYPQDTYPEVGYDPTYAASGIRNVYGDDLWPSRDSSLEMTAPVTIPPNAYMHFAHAYGFDDWMGLYFDGGVVEYTVGNEKAWHDAGDLFTHNGYEGELELQSENPLEGRSAFVGDSHGYISSRIDLSSLAGQSVRFRFRVGTDYALFDYGWFIDDIRIYTCGEDAVPPHSVNVGGAGLSKRFQRAKAFLVSWSALDDESGVASYDVRYRKGTAPRNIGSGFTTWKEASSSTSARFTGRPGTTYCFSARGRDAAGNESDWSAENCTSVPANNTQMAHQGDWARKKTPGFYLRTVSVSSTKGSSLSMEVNAKRLAVVATKCQGCGSIKVLLGKSLLKQISLAANTTSKKQLIPVAKFTAPRTGAVRIVVTSAGKPVRIEGLGVTK